MPVIYYSYSFLLLVRKESRVPGGASALFSFPEQ
jgi:hypothetical protein